MTSKPNGSRSKRQAPSPMVGPSSARPGPRFMGEVSNGFPIARADHLDMWFRCAALAPALDSLPILIVLSIPWWCFL